MSAELPAVPDSLPYSRSHSRPTMTPKQRFQRAFHERTVSTLPRWALTLIALIPLAGVLAGAARFIKQTADARYVLNDSLRAYQQGMAIQHRTDSLVIDAKIDKLSVPVNALYRACQRRRECP